MFQGLLEIKWSGDHPISCKTSGIIVAEKMLAGIFRNFGVKLTIKW